MKWKTLLGKKGTGWVEGGKGAQMEPTKDQQERR